MDLYRIRIEGDPVLHQKCAPVHPDDFHKVADAARPMVEVMKIVNGIGLAANQVGILKRFFIWGKEAQIVVNPEILSSEGEVRGVEGCLSLPNWGFTVTRPEYLEVRYSDIEGGTHEVDLMGQEAVIWSHEIHHLEGTLVCDVCDPFERRQLHAMQWGLPTDAEAEELRQGRIA